MEKTRLNIAKALSALPQEITHLDMSNLLLGDVSLYGGAFAYINNQNELIKLFKEIPKTIKILNLSNNTLASLNIDLLVTVIELLPELDSLDLSRNNLDTLGFGLSTFLNRLPKVNALNLSNNGLGNCSKIELLVSWLPLSINTLDLSCNKLYLRQDEFSTLLFHLKCWRLKLLDLSENGLNSIAIKELVKSFTIMTSSVKEFISRYKNYEHASREDLTLIVDNNELEYKNFEELALIDSAFSIPIRVTINARPIQSYLTNRSTALQWSHFQGQDTFYEYQKKTEWCFALEQLKEADDGRYIHYSAILDKSSNSFNPRLSRPDLFNRCPKTTGTFIKINGVIYRIVPKDENIFAVPGRADLKRSGYNIAGMPQIKLLENKDGYRFVAKKVVRGSNDEHEILYDLNMTLGYVSKKNRLDQYMVMFYLGQTLSTITLLTKEQRLQIAIDVCLEVARLHEGSLSRTNTSYAHYDLKPGNIVKDDNNKVHLIDFGRSQKNCKLIHTNSHGTPLYRPPDDKPLQLTGEQYDVFALQRILFITEAVAKAYHCDEIFLLTEAIIKEFNLLTLRSSH